VEASNFVLLLTVTRSTLDTYIVEHAPGYYFLLSVASPTRLTKYDVLHLSEMNEYLNIWNLMTYDYARSWSNLTGHQANLYPSISDPNSTPFSSHKAITDYTVAGIPTNKIVIRIPLYGRLF
jgi:chitinase